MEKVVTVLEVLLFLIIMYWAYHLMSRIYKNINKKILDAQGRNVSKYNPDSLIKKYYNKTNEITNDKIQNKLDKLGNPLNLNTFTYFLLKIVAGIVFLILSIYARYPLLVDLVLPVAGYFSVDILYRLSNKNDEEEIKNDLPDVYDMVTIQSAGGVSIGLALTETYNIVRNKRLQKLLTKLAAEINITKNIPESLDHFKNNFNNFFEVEIFVLSIKQSLETGKSIEILENQSKLLKEYKKTRVQAHTKYITRQLITITLLIFAGLIALVFYAFKSQLSNALTNIFQ